MMLKLLVFIFFLVVSAVADLSDVDKCVLQFQSTLKNKTTIKALSGITGIGWNDLDNTVTLPIYSTTFKNCLSVPDNDFLIPDNVFAIPLKDIDMQQSSETFDSFDEFIKSSSDKVTVEASGSFKGFSAGGSFSYENQETKRDFSKKNTYMLQNKLVYKAYQFIANQHNGLDPLFLERLEEVAEELKNGKYRVAKYKAQLIINDYGTHVINSATVGAEITQNTFVERNEEFHGKEWTQTIKTEIEAGFKAIVSVKTGYENKRSESETQQKISSKTKSVLKTKGGPDVSRLAAANPKDSMLFIDNLVGLEPRGIYIHQIIRSSKINYADDIKELLYQEIYEATLEYYKRNTIAGCTDPKTENFNFLATVEDGSCIKANQTFAFGGFYQKCQQYYSASPTLDSYEYDAYCEELGKMNPVTNNFTCPPNYIEQKIDTMILTKFDRQATVNKTICHWYLFVKICNQEKVFEAIEDRYLLTTFWCFQMNDHNITKPVEPQTPKGNKLQRIMTYETLATLEESPAQLALFFPDIPINNDNLTEIADTQDDDDDKRYVIDVTPTQLEDLLLYPNILKKLLPYFPINIPMADRTTTASPFVGFVPHGYVPPTSKPRPDTLISYFKNFPDQIKELSENPELLRHHLFPQENVQPPKFAHLAFFGGIYENEQNNPFTGSPSCPLNFKAHTFMTRLNICIWVDQVAEWPISLGGIFHCKSQQQQCPRGYSQYLGGDFDGCRLYYCIRMQNRKKFDFPSINRPPYVNIDEVLNEIKVEVKLFK